MSTASLQEDPIVVTPTGSRLTMHNAGSLLSYWCQAVGHRCDFQYQNVFPPGHQAARSSVKAVPGEAQNGSTSNSTATPTSLDTEGTIDPPIGSLRVCSVVLPLLGLVRSADTASGGWRSKQLAKTSASFEAVKMLLARGELTDELIPSPSIPRPPGAKGDSTPRITDRIRAAVESRLPARSAKPNANGQPGIDTYPYVTTPTFWSTCPLFAPDTLYATVLELKVDPPHDSTYAEGTCRSLALITTRPLPILNGGIYVHAMRIKHESTVAATMRMIDGGRMKKWEDGKLDQVMRFTERLLRGVTHRPLRGELDRLKWLVVPLRYGSASFPLTDTRRRLRRKDVSWDEIEKAANGPLYTPLDRENPEQMRAQCTDAMVSSPSEFTRRDYLHVQDLDCPSGSSAVAPSTPVLSFELEPVRTAKTGGHVAACASPVNRRTVTQLPDDLARHCILASVFRTASNLPHFLHELDSTLIAAEMNSAIFSSTLSIPLALQAITIRHHGSDINEHYERLEFMGDTLLKLINTIQVYIADANGSQDILEILQDRHVMSSNRTLRAHAINAGLAKYIRTRAFAVKDWLPRDWDLRWSEMGPTAGDNDIEAITSEPRMDSRPIGDKVLADVLEALLGAAYVLNRSLDEVLLVASKLGIKIKGVKKWSDLARALPPPAAKAPKIEAGYMAFFKKNDGHILGYTFRDAERLADVLSLDMSDGRRKQAFDRYRMLGNAVLDYFIVEHLWKTYPLEGPGPLTKMKGSRACEGVRSALATELGLLDLLRDGDDQTQRQVASIKRATKATRAKADAARRQAASRGEDDEENGLEWWLNVPNVKTTSDPLEALLGAITHDASFDLSPARRIHERHIQPFLEKYCSRPSHHDSHPKAQLYEYMQSRGCQSWSLDKVKEPMVGGSERAEVRVHGQVVAQAKGKTASLAMRGACQAALVMLRDQGGLDRLCTCATLRVGKKAQRVKG
ncbi:hypothetical protein IAU60_002917 [Kwoniella sp. DSM 27419]